MTEKPKQPDIVLKFDICELAVRMFFLNEEPDAEAKADPMAYLRALDEDTQFLLMHTSNRAMEYFQEKFIEAVSGRGELHIVKVPREEDGKPH